MMRKGMLTLAVLGVGVLALLAPTNSHAICAQALTFGQVDYHCGGGTLFCYLVTPINPDNADNLASSFWSLDTGNPAVGMGDDNGDWADNNWLRPYANNFYMTGTWAQDNAIDGCIQDQIPAGHAEEVMVAAWSEESGGAGFFATAAVRRQAANNTEFDFTLCDRQRSVDPCQGAPQDIVMVEIPQPNIIGSSAISLTERQVTIGAPDFSAGFYASDASISQDEVIVGYRVYQQTFDEGTDAPASRDIADWTDASGLVAPGVDTTFNLTCGVDSDIYLATAPEYNQGFTSGDVSANSNIVKCGPNLADPDDRFKQIERPDLPGRGPKKR